MKTHKYNWKLFNVEYSSVRIWETWERLRMDSDFYDFIYLSRIEKVKAKNFDTLWNNLSILTDYHANGSYLILNQNVEIKSEKDFALMIRTTDLENNNFENDVKYISESAYNFLTKTKVYWWEIIINKIWSAWKVYLMPDLNKPVSLWMNAFLLKTHSNLLEKYLYIYLHTHFWEKIIQQKINWAVPLSIDKASIRDIVIPMASFPFQQKIEKLVIESYEQKEFSELFYQEAQNLLLSELDLLNYKTKTKNITLQWWLDMEILENHATINYKTLQELDRFDAEYWDYDFVAIKDRIKYIKSEKLWNLINYKKWIEVWTEAYIEESEIDTTEDKKYFVRVSNFSKFWMTFNNSKFIKNNHFEDLQDYQPQQWEILFSKDGTAWIAYLLRENIDGIISWWILRFQNISDIPSEYIELVLNSIVIQKEVERQTNGALIQHLKITDALNFNIPLIWDDKIKIITKKIQKSFQAKKQSQYLLELAKTAVEIYIEQDEESAFVYMDINI